MIAILDNCIIDKIAAGEVVERPASIVKELMENAIDGGATAITIEIKNGGIDFIRITDNGSGIAKEEIATAFLRHATSKIKTDQDLLQIKSLGFRGEALSSIAAVTRVEFISKTRTELTGTRYCIEGGKEIKLEEIGAPEGTTIIARDIFFNTPVRRKFLKSAQTESAYITDYVEKLALVHTDIAIRLISNQQSKFQTSGNGNQKDVIYQIYGKEVVNSLLRIDYMQSGIYITGFIAKPEFSKGNRGLENYYINGRWIKDKNISLAIEEGFGNRLMQHQYPFTVLNIQINPEIVDVNVHPAKLQVRFENPLQIYEIVREAVQRALLGKELIKKVNLDEEKIRNKGRRESPIYIEETQSFKENSPSFRVLQKEEEKYQIVKEDNIKKNNIFSKPNSRPPEIFETNRNQKYMEFLREKEWKENEPKGNQLRFIDVENVHLHRIIGQIFDTYWLVEFEQKLYIIDQHAAHEKVLYEQYYRVYQESKVGIQMLAIPLIISLTELELNIVEEYKDIWEKMGFEIESFGGKEVKVSGIPSLLPSVSKVEVLKEWIGMLANGEYKKTPEQILSKTASMACKAAVKGNDILSYTEASKLIEDLLKLENPYTCPHGRPTMIQISKQEMEKKFKRIV